MVVRWGIVGCGDVAEHKGGPALYHARGSQLVAVMSRTEARAASFARRHGAKRHYTRFEDLLNDGEVDAVYVATPPHVHAQQAIACARAGKHVLCEKPMALTLAECDEMIRVADECGVQLMVAYYRRLFPAVLRIKELIEGGRIGRPTKIRAETASCYTPPPDGSSPWRVDPATAGGGFLWDIGSHRIDLMTYLLGDVIEVAAFVDTVAFDVKVDDSASLILRFAGAAHGVGVFHWNVSHGGDEIEVGGTGGRVVCDLNRHVVTLTADGGIETWTLSPPDIMHLAIVEDFVHAISEGRENCVSGREGRKANAILEAAERSSRERRVVRVR